VGDSGGVPFAVNKGDIASAGQAAKEVSIISELRTLFIESYLCESAPLALTLYGSLRATFGTSVFQKAIG
jgi:hypothetical protein